MKLLWESKRAWLLPYIIMWLITGGLYYFKWDNATFRTIGLMIGVIQLIILIEFILIVLFKWMTACRMIGFLVFLGSTIYLGVNKYLSKWYVIIPVFLFLTIYFLWNLGGVKNCIMANAYKNVLDSRVKNGREMYDLYSAGVDVYNDTNNLTIFGKARTKKRPKWEKMEFSESGLEMFGLINAIFGIDTDRWQNNVEKLTRINSRLLDKNQAIVSNLNIREEKNSLERIVGKNNKMKVDNHGLDKQISVLEKKRKKGLKKERKILKRRL